MIEGMVKDGNPTAEVELTKHDQRAVQRFGEVVGWLDIQLADYLVLNTSDRLRRQSFRSWWSQQE